MVLERFASIEEKPLVLREVPSPQPGEEEILVEISVCGVCHTDLHTVEGELPQVKLPIIPGHQVVGKVKELGSRASRFTPGDRVGIAWLYSTDETCDFCRQGKENLCVGACFTGYHVNGGYAEYIKIHEKFAYPIPRGFPDIQAAPLLCAGIIGYRALCLSKIKPGQRLGLIGFGASAHVAIQVAVYWGCEVYVFSRSAEHRSLAEKLGAAWTGTLADNPPAKLHSIVNFTPAGSTVPAAMELLERGGTQALAGICMTPIPEMDYQEHLYWEKTLRSVANATRQDGEELLELAAKIPIETTVESYSLKEANEVLLRLKKSEIDGAAVLVLREE